VRLGDRLSTLTLTNCDTEGNTPPKLFKPGTTLHTIDGARMHFPDERADEFVPLLRDHWARTRS
jgi:hypothetical protein